MDKHLSVNVVEKQRLRDSIEEQIRRFLETGGNITVLDGPLSEQGRYRGSMWHGDSDDAPVLD